MVKWRILVTLTTLVAALSQGAWGMSIADAKKLPDGQAVSLAQKAVTYSATGYFYVEEDVRNIGIRVEKADHPLAVGMRANVIGIVQTKTTGNKERYIAASSAVQSEPPDDSNNIAPITMGNASLGGADWMYTSPSTAGQKGATGMLGLNNIGLLVRTWGRYEQLDATTFTVDDGAGLYVKCSVPSGFFLYSGWQYVVVTGISTIYKFNSVTYPPHILVSDVDVMLPPESVSAPGAPTGEQNPVVNVSYAYSATVSACSQGHPVEYSFDWGDGSSSPWSTSPIPSHAWSAVGSNTITVTARCQIHPGVSAVSPGTQVNVQFGPYEMIYIPAGSFLMGNSGVGNDAAYGNSNEFPQHSVSLSGYWIGKYEVTRGEYRQFMDAGAYSNPAYWSTDGWSWKVANGRTQPDYWAAQQDWGTGTFTQTDSHPVVGVCYYECEAFCNWAGGHLATEAQWEKAARWTGTYPNVYPWGNTWDPEKCNNYYDHNAAGGGYHKYQTSPVGSYPSGTSPYGLMDMAGNVWEWVQDWYVSYPGSSSPFDYTGTRRVLRSGGWTHTDNYLRCATRSGDFPYYVGYINYSYGFRLAR